MLSTKDLYSILQVTNHPTPFALIVASLCPTIYGHELVKAGLVLSLFGGSKRQDDRRDTSLRSDVHVLVVGDPGLGKSQMLTAVHKLAPRGVYVCGSYASTAGLTVSIQKDAGSHDFALEAGALVLANNGVACIDELDKMPNDLDALLEAMEQQQISVAKAGIVCSLPARATIMAAANPRHGHYDKSKSIAENLNMSTALLSRFDLIFVLLDKPDAQQDQRISEHIFGQHAGLEGSKDPTQHSNMFKEFQMMQPEVGSVPLPHQSQAGRGTIPATSQGDFVAPPSLLERLKAYDPRSGQGILSHTLLSRYLTYAKRYVEPVLTAPAKRVLQDFYLSLRRSRSSQDGTPVTTRQLESLIRLAEARAKVELRNEVTEQDVRDVIEIMKESLRDALDANGFESVDIRATGVRGDRKQKQIFVQELQKRARSSGKNEFTKQELYEISRQLKITPASSFDDFLDHLNHAGFILRSGSRSWKVYGIS
jgi:DNA helicase MCM8